eukprot:4070611-Prymnesium_polylepis.1
MRQKRVGSELDQNGYVTMAIASVTTYQRLTYVTNAERGRPRLYEITARIVLSTLERKLRAVRAAL